MALRRPPREPCAARLPASNQTDPRQQYRSRFARSPRSTGRSRTPTRAHARRAYRFPPDRTVRPPETADRRVPDRRRDRSGSCQSVSMAASERERRFLEAEHLVELRSADLRKELRLRDLVAIQVLYIVGLSWIGAAAKMG